MADRSQVLKERLLATFRVEAADHIKTIRTDLAAFAEEQAESEKRERLESLFRTVHTLKGAARSVGNKPVEIICQECETTLRDLTRTAPLPTDTEPTVAMIQRMLKDISGRLEEQAGAPTTPRPAPRPAPSPSPGDIPEMTASAAQHASPEPEPEVNSVTVDSRRRPMPQTADQIRVEVQRLDQLVYRAESLLTPKLSLGNDVGAFRALIREFVAVADDAGRSRVDAADVTDAAAMGDLTDGKERFLEIRDKARALLGRLEDDFRAIRTSIDDLFVDLKEIRMMPVSHVVEVFPGMVADLAEETGKDVEWRMTGTSLELDRKVLEYIKDPLIHIVRNAIDHGIESPDVRAELGKPRRASASLSFSRLEGGRILIEIRDDGAGIDLTRVKEAAVRLHLLDKNEADELTDEKAQDLIFRSGLSTSSVISMISGHGLGLSVVRERVERLGGAISVETKKGRGTRVSMTVPESMATFRGLLIRVSDHQYLLPPGSVVEARLLNRQAYVEALGRKLLEWNGMTVPFGNLSSVLQSPSDLRGETGNVSCILVQNGSEHAAFAVDGVLGDQECLVKEFQWPIRRLPNISAVGLLGTGDLSFILRPSDLVRAVHFIDDDPVQDSAAAEQFRAHHILVVDDSLTTRTMERHLFEAAGFRVSVAPDGLEAWDVLNAESVDLVVSDIDMPRMNGFELTEKVRATPRFADLPIVLVTALETRDDKQRGLDVGANAYVLKSNFDQSNLLEIVRRFL